MRTPVKLFAAFLMPMATLVACSSGTGGGDGGGASIGPAGGTITSANGVQLVIPAGALDAGVAITLTDVSAAQVDPIISNPAFTSTLTKRFLGGFTAEPEGLTFNVPVAATVPVLTLNPEETPVQLSVQLDQQTYSYTSSTLEYDGNGPTVTLELAHFSTEVVVGLSPPQLNQLCTSCGTYDSAPCATLDPEQPPCCLMPPDVLATCAVPGGCTCCEAQKVTVVSAATDNTAGNCDFLGEDLSVTFPLCPDKTPRLSCQYESNCPDMTLELTITPPNACVFVGQEQVLSATATGTLNGEIEFEDVPFSSLWTSDDTSVVDFMDPHSGSLQGVAPSPTPVEVQANLCSCSPITATANANAFNLGGQWLGVGAVTSSSCGGSAHALNAVFTITQQGDAVTITGDGQTQSGDFDDPGFSLFAPIETNWNGCPTVIHHCAKTLSADDNTISVTCDWLTTCTDNQGNVTSTCSGTYGATFTRTTPDCP